MDIVVVDSLEYIDDLHAVLSSTNVILDKLSAQLAYTTVSNTILDKLSTQLAYTTVSNAILDKLSAQLAYTTVSNAVLDKLSVQIAYEVLTITPLDVDIADTINKFDSFELDAGILVTQSDLLYTLTEAQEAFLAVTIFLEVQDNTPWAIEFFDIFDLSTIAIGNLVAASDSFDYSDLVNLLLKLEITLSEILSSTDTISILNSYVIKSFSVSLKSDWLTLNNIVYINYIDYLSLADLINLLTGYVSSDLIQYEDQVELLLNNVYMLQTTSADTILFDDNISITNILSDDYIRRYLNDRLLRQGDILLPYAENLILQDGINIGLM